MPSHVRRSLERCLDCEHRTDRLFCNLGHAALQRFDQIGSHLSIPGRTVVFDESQPANSVFVVCTGQLKLSTTSRAGRTMILRLAGPGDILGLSAMLNDQPHEVTAQTLEPTQLKKICRKDFLVFLEDNAEVGDKASRTIAREYREVFLDARRLAISGSATGRLAQLLLEWANTAACGKPELRFNMSLTHEELASLAGTSRETVTRLLNQFERDHLIIRRGVSVSIPQPEALAALGQ